MKPYLGSPGFGRGCSLLREEVEVDVGKVLKQCYKRSFDSSEARWKHVGKNSDTHGANLFPAKEPAPLNLPGLEFSQRGLIGKVALKRAAVGLALSLLRDRAEGVGESRPPWSFYPW